MNTDEDLKLPFIPFPLPELPRIPSVEFNLRAFGAVEGGQTLNTAAFAAAIAAAHEAGGGRVVVPNGIWLTGPIHFKDRIELHLEAGAEIRFSQNPDDYLPVVLAQRGGTMLYNYSPLLYAYGCEDIALTGSGVLDGQGVAWWPWKFNSPGTRTYLVDIPEKGIPLEQRVFGTREAKVRPVMCQPIECERVLIEGVTLRNSPSWTVQPVWCREVTLRGVTVSNPPSPFSYNTDGIDPDACRNVLIEHCDVSTGDDAICLKAGRGPDAWKDGRPLENVLIRHCRIGFGHGGITIGSEMSAGVRNVYAHDCEMDGVDRGIRVKSCPGRGGFVENFIVERVNMCRVAHAVDINLYYAGNREETLDIENLRHVPRFEHFVLRDITCESADHAVTLRGLPGYPIKDIRMENVEIRAVHTGLTEHVEDLLQENVRVLPLDGPAWLRGDDDLPEIAAARRVAARIEGPEMTFPAEKRPMAGRHTVAIAHADAAAPLRLFWEAAACPEGPAVLRITVSVDHRCLHRVSAANAATGEPLGECVVPFGCPGEPCDGQPSGPETTGPWAVFARTLGYNHQHPALALAEACFEKHYDPRTDSVGHQVVAETSYNIAYPMMAMARFTERPALQARALRQLEANRQYLPDTSGSAGIAAATALAVRHGMLGREHLATARRTRDALMKQLTPDGWLRGVSQSNKSEAAGMDLQRSTHRVIAPWGMGLFAQLLANLAGCPMD